MSKFTSIEWADGTFNPVVGCKAISPGCAHCYAEALARRTGQDFATPRRTKDWSGPGKWNKKALYQCGDCGWRGETESNCPSCAAEVHTARRRIFCASMADVFDNQWNPQWRADLFTLIQATPNLDWLLLTKRIGNAAPMIAQAASGATAGTALHAMTHLWLAGAPPTNVWLGATVVNQEEADRDIPKLLTTSARVRFLSCEPLLGPLSLKHYLRENNWRADGSVTTRGIVPGTRLDWVIAGGESGPGARPSHPDWHRALAGQCRAAGVPFFMKQMGGARDKRGAMDDLPEDLRVRGFPNGQ